MLRIIATDTFECKVVFNLQFDDLMSFILPILHITIVFHNFQVFPIYHMLKNNYSSNFDLTLIIYIV